MPEITEAEITEMSPEEKREYAKSQYDFLKAQGITDRLRLSRIFKAAGPGQVQEAWKVATCKKWEEDPIGKDLLDCLLEGLTSIGVDFGVAKAQKVLEECEFYTPKAFNARCFFRILEGAHEILIPGAHRFSREEIREIEDGLNKH